MGRRWVADVTEHAHRDQLRGLRFHALDDVQGAIVNATEEWASRGEHTRVNTRPTSSIAEPSRRACSYRVR